jgi:hypothetical protein
MIYEKTLHRKLKIEKHDIIFSHLQNVILLLYVEYLNTVQIQTL